MLVIDNRLTYCGSQNCADPEFRIKAKFAPWVDAMMRFEGPIARQNQYLFASDWMAQMDGDLTPLLRQPLLPCDPGLTAQVIGTGPTVYNSAMPEASKPCCTPPDGSWSSRLPIMCPTKACRPSFVPVPGAA